MVYLPTQLGSWPGVNFGVEPETISFLMDGNAETLIFHVSHEKNPGWLGYIRDYTTQLYRDYNKPLLGSLLTNQYNGK